MIVGGSPNPLLSPTITNNLREPYNPGDECAKVDDNTNCNSEQRERERDLVG